MDVKHLITDLLRGKKRKTILQNISKKITKQFWSPTVIIKATILQRNI